MNARVQAAVVELVASIEELIGAAREEERPAELLSIDEAARRLGIGRTALYGQISGGKLRSVKVGRRRLVPANAVADLIYSLDRRADE